MIYIRSLYKFFYSVGTASLKIGRGQADQDVCPCVPTSILEAYEPAGAHGITTQGGDPETIGNPYLDGDVFCVFDFFDFTDGNMVFDNRFAADNISLFCADEVETIDSHVNQLTADAIVEYLKDEAQDYGIPIFVDHADIKLSEAQALEVILAHLMGDYYYFTRGVDKPKRWEFTQNNIEYLQSYLPEKGGDNKALATIINLARAKNIPVLSKYYNGMNGMVNNKKKAKQTPYKIESEKIFHQKQGTTLYKSRRIKNDPIQWFNEP